MLASILARAIQSVPVLLAVTLLAFIVFRFIGDPTLAIIGQEASDEQREALIRSLGLDRPLPLQYADFLWRALHGEFGNSYRLGRPVADIIAGALPATVELAVGATLFSVLLGVPLGIVAAIHHKRLLARIAMMLTLVGVSLPSFVVAIGLILWFSVVLGLLPSFGRGQVVTIAGWWTTGLLTASGLKALILPSVTLGLFQLALVMRLVRAEFLDVLRSDYVRFARARGLSVRAINFGIALKNTLVPVVTIVGLQLGGFIAYAIVTETVFQWPGIGLLFIQAVNTADIPIVSTYLLLVALLFVATNLVVDILCRIIDPRIAAGDTLQGR